MTLTRVPWKTPKTAKVARAGRIDPKLRRLVYDRAGGRCECCAELLHIAAYECHHRKLRSRGGQDSSCNLAALCRDCHRRLHSRVKFATEHGFIVSAFDDPASVPMLLTLADSVYLTSDGKYRAAS